MLGRQTVQVRKKRQFGLGVKLRQFFGRPLSFPVEKIALSALLVSFSAPLFSAADPCLLCKIQRFGWLFGLVFSVVGWQKTKLSLALMWLTRVALTAVFVAAALQMLVQLGVIPDLCHAPKTAFTSPEDYLAYLTNHPPCDEAILKIMGVPAYALSLIGSLSALVISFFTNQKNAKEFL
ncbi:MAG: disulfide bond formation protein B [Chlamydiota bacterium]